MRYLTLDETLLAKEAMEKVMAQAGRNVKHYHADNGRLSVDQIVSSQPGLIPQISGFLTSKRLLGATIFVYHVSDYVYVHLMRDLTLDETLLDKEAM